MQIAGLKCLLWLLGLHQDLTGRIKSIGNEDEQKCFERVIEPSSGSAQNIS